MYFVVFQNPETKTRWFVAFTDKEQFEEDYDPTHGDVIAPGVSQEKAKEICKEPRSSKEA